MNGLMQRFNGSVKIGRLVLGKNIVDSASGIMGAPVFTMKIALPVTATATTAFTVSLPPGGSLVSAAVWTTVAYTGNTVTVALGSAAAGTDYVAATTIKALGNYPLTLVQAGAAGPAIMPVASPNLFVTVTQTATTTAVGHAFLLLTYTGI